MAFFRNTSFFTGICKGPRSHLIKIPQLIRQPLLTSNKCQLFSTFQNPRCSLTKTMSRVENRIAVQPVTLIKSMSVSSRGFHSSSTLQQNQQADKTPTFGEQMSLRLINENGFLSWTRNSYLSAAVGATMLNGANVDVVQHAGVLVLVVSAMNMTWGSACHFTNLLRIKDRCAMSRPVLLLNLLGCVVHALLWLFILGYYIHFSGHTGWIRRRRRQHKDTDGSNSNREQ